MRKHAASLLLFLICLGLYIATGQGEWLVGVLAIAILNLVNLAPAPPLDGSKALGPVLANAYLAVKRSEYAAFAAEKIEFELEHHLYKF